MNVAVIYGLFEGPLLCDKLREALKNNAHTYVNNSQVADIVIAHSGGALFVKRVHDQRIIFIDPPSKNTYIALNILRHISYDLRHVALTHPTFYLKKTLINFWYLLTNINRSLDMLQALRSGENAPWNDDHVEIILTSDRSWTDTKKLKHFSVLNSDHDSLWREPKMYLEKLGL